MSILEFDEADRCYDEILKIEPDHAGAIGDKGAVQAEKGNYRESITFFDRSLKIEPDNARINK